jgi:hypothetical protein
MIPASTAEYGTTRGGAAGDAGDDRPRRERAAVTPLLRAALAARSASRRSRCRRGRERDAVVRGGVREQVLVRGSVVRPGIATWPGPRSGVNRSSAFFHCVSVAFAWSSVPPVSAVAAIDGGDRGAGAERDVDVLRSCATSRPRLLRREDRRRLDEVPLSVTVS